jgi:hypothetical protein
MEDIVAEDWHEQLLVTFARRKTFFGYLKDKQQDELIKFAQAPSCAHADVQI